MERKQLLSAFKECSRVLRSSFAESHCVELEGVKVEGTKLYPTPGTNPRFGWKALYYITANGKRIGGWDDIQTATLVSLKWLQKSN
jgi:hypothetical protein